jgi:hypothetical protein
MRAVTLNRSLVDRLNPSVEKLVDTPMAYPASPGYGLDRIPSARRALLGYQERYPRLERPRRKHNLRAVRLRGLRYLLLKFS